MFLYDTALKVSKLQGCGSCRIWLSSLKGIQVARGAKVEKVAKSDFLASTLLTLKGFFWITQQQVKISQWNFSYS